MKESTLKAAQIDKALCIVVTIDNTFATQQIVKAVRRKCSSTPIIVRAHAKEDTEFFNDFENVDAIAENILISKKLSAEVFKQSGYFEKHEA